MPDIPDDPVDTIVLASRGARVTRGYTLASLPRVAEAGAHAGTAVDLTLSFSEVDGKVWVDTSLSGKAVLTCQRCLKPVDVPLAAESQLVLAGTEAEAEQVPEGREALVAAADRLDLRWLAEEETLLALPLVPLHDAACAAAGTDTDATGDSPPDDGREKRNRPFENLRDLLDKH